MLHRPVIIGIKVCPEMKSGPWGTVGGELGEKRLLNNAVFMMPLLRPGVGKQDKDRFNGDLLGKHFQKQISLGTQEVKIGQFGPIAFAFPPENSVLDDIDPDTKGFGMSLCVAGQKMPVATTDLPNNTLTPPENLLQILTQLLLARHHALAMFNRTLQQRGLLTGLILGHLGQISHSSELNSRRKQASPFAANTARLSLIPSTKHFRRALELGLSQAGTFMLIALNKPYGILSQFTPEPGSKWGTLSSLGLPPRVYPIGRLDADSEGLLLLSDEKALVDRLLNPRHAHARTYWVQVERIPEEAALNSLRNGVSFGGHTSLPCLVECISPQPLVPARTPPIRARKNVPDCWLSMTLTEGKNRQVRRMTAAVGHPTLRLLRASIGTLTLQQLSLPPGRWKYLEGRERDAALSG